MHPVFFSLGPITLYTFGVFLFLAFFAAVFTVWLHGRREGFNEEKILDACLFVCLFGVVGGRIGYFLAHRDLFCVSCFFRVSVVPGFSWLGAVFSGFWGLWFFCQKEKLNFLKLLDLVVLGIALGEGIGRLGCFFSGWFLFLLEFLKEEGIYLGRIKFSQAVGLLVSILGTAWLYRSGKRNLREDVENMVSYLISKGGKVCLLLSRVVTQAQKIKNQKFKIKY